MALANSDYRESTFNQSWYDSAFRSTYDLELKPQTWGEVIDRYGPGLSFCSFLNLAGRTQGLKSPTITIFEKGAPIRPVKVSISTDAAPINTTTVTLDVTDGSNAYMRAGFDIIIPAAYTNRDYDVPLRIAGTAGSWTGTCADVGAAITTALDEVYCAVGASSFGFGTGQPDPMSSGTYSRTTEQRIIKSTIGIEGGILYQEEWEDFKLKHGGRGVWTRSIAELDYDLDDQMDSALLTGITNTNPALTAASVSGTTAAIPSFDGLIQVMNDLGQELTWDATGFDLDKFKAVKVLLENVGVVNRKVDFFVATDLNASIEDELQDYLNTNAGGTKYWDEIGKVGFMVNSVKTNSVDFKIAELTSLSNPNKFGLDSYNFRKMGFMFTQAEYPAIVDMAGEKVGMTLPHLTLGYPDSNGEGRQRVFVPNPGVHGIQGMPPIATNEYDGIRWYALAHMIPIWNHMYQTIKVEYDVSGGGGS